MLSLRQTTNQRHTKTAGGVSNREYGKWIDFALGHGMTASQIAMLFNRRTSTIRNFFNYFGCMPGAREIKSKYHDEFNDRLLNAAAWALPNFVDVDEYTYCIKV